MPETAIKQDRNTDEKQRIRDRYKGVELEELDVIPATPQEDFYSESTTKRVAVYARNIIDCIGYVRELKATNPPIGVFSETENIFTLNANSEMSLSFIANSSQEYQRNISMRHVKDAAAHFDLNQVNPVKVSRREGTNMSLTASIPLRLLPWSPAPVILRSGVWSMTTWNTPMGQTLLA